MTSQPIAAHRLVPRRGRVSPLLAGFTFTGGEPRWARGTPVALVLAALTVGTTWGHAATCAHLAADTPNRWNTRGREALGDHATLDDLAAVTEDLEIVAYAAFHLAAGHARTVPILGALEEITRAASGGDWRAAAHLLRVLPEASPYRPDPRLEVTGREDGPPKFPTDGQRAFLGVVSEALDAVDAPGKERIMRALGGGAVDNA